MEKESAFVYANNTGRWLSKRYPRVRYSLRLDNVITLYQLTVFGLNHTEFHPSGDLALEQAHMYAHRYDEGSNIQVFKIGANPLEIANFLNFIVGADIAFIGRDKFVRGH